MDPQPTDSHFEWYYPLLLEDRVLFISVLLTWRSDYTLFVHSLQALCGSIHVNTSRTVVLVPGPAVQCLLFTSSAIHLLNIRVGVRGHSHTWQCFICQYNRLAPPHLWLTPLPLRNPGFHHCLPMDNMVYELLCWQIVLSCSICLTSEEFYLRISWNICLWQDEDHYFLE